MSGPKPASFEAPAELVELLIEREGLRTETGAVMCWNCRYRVAKLPGLYCDGCAEPHRRGW